MIRTVMIKETTSFISTSCGLALGRMDALRFLGSLKYDGSKYFLRLNDRVLFTSASASDGVGLGVRVTSR